MRHKGKSGYGKSSSKVAIIILVSIILIIVIAAVMKFLLLPRFTAQIQNTMVWMGGILLVSITVLAGLAQLTGYSLKDIFAGSSRPAPAQVLEEAPDTSAIAKRPSWVDYIELFQIHDYRIAYIPVINDWAEGNAIRYFDWEALNINLDTTPFVLDRVFRTLPVTTDYRDDPSCRLEECSIKAQGDFSLSLKFQETSYGDYLRSGEHLDDPFPDNPRETFRSTLASIIMASGGKVKPEKLTNICGTGIFLITKDEKIIVSKHPDLSHVYPGRLSFSASGLMKWGVHPHPFMEMARKTFQEIQFQVRPDKTKLIGFGADARKLYFQFSFVEYIDQTSDQIIEHYQQVRDYENQGLLRDRPHELISLPFDLTEIRDSVLDFCWEPSAEAVLLTVCAEHFGVDSVASALHSRQRDWTRKNMLDEWDYRASRSGFIPDMSVRYPPEQLAEEIKRHLSVIFEFAGADLLGKNVVEIGCGTGNITAHLVEVAGRVTCLDLSEKMIAKNKERLGSKAEKVSYVQQFGQEYNPPERHDVAICSRVLIHNTSDSDFRELVRSICNCAKIVFVFEDVSQDRPTSETTKLRPKSELVSAFARHGFRLIRSSADHLFEDEIALLKFSE